MNEIGDIVDSFDFLLKFIFISIHFPEEKRKKYS